MESLKHKESRYKNGGISSSNCFCGRSWFSKPKPGASGRTFFRICFGCKKLIRRCNCDIIK